MIKKNESRAEQRKRRSKVKEELESSLVGLEVGSCAEATGVTGPDIDR
jgi:hypothetical protein